MTDEQLQAKISECLELIKYSSKSLTEAPDRATKFLIMQAFLVDAKRAAEEDRVKLTTLSEMTYSQAIGKANGGITERKLEADRDEEYQGAREALGDCEAKISWLRGYIDVMNNAHIVYRNLMKE